MPMSLSFKKRLFPILPEIVEHFGTPFHLYDESGIRDTGIALINAFSEIEAFREYFAVKALPNPHIIELMQQLGFGFDYNGRLRPKELLLRPNGSVELIRREERNAD